MLGKRAFDGEIITGLGLSPDGQLLFVTLLSPPAGAGVGDEGTRRTVLMEVAKNPTIGVDLVELRAIEGAVKTMRFSVDSRTIDMDGRLFAVGPIVADEPFPVLTPKDVRFSDDSSRMNVLSQDGHWKLFDAASLAETASDAAATAPPVEAPTGEIKAEKSGEGIEVSVDGQEMFKAVEPRIVLGGASEDGNFLIWVRDDGSAQVVALMAGELGEKWEALGALHGHPWNGRTDDFLTFIDGHGAKWKLIYRAEMSEAIARSFGAIAPNSVDPTTSTTVALHPGGRIAAIGTTGSSRPGVSLIEAATGRPLLEPIDIGSEGMRLFFSRDGSSLFVETFSGGSANGEFKILEIANGFSLMRARVYAGPFVERPDGKRVAVLGGNGDGAELLFDVLGDVTPVPLWIADMAEGVGGWRLGEQNILRPLTAPEQSERVRITKNAAAGNADADRWAEFARWYLSDAPDPPVSPYSHMLRSQLAKKQADELARARQPLIPRPRLSRRRQAGRRRRLSLLLPVRSRHQIKMPPRSRLPHPPMHPLRRPPLLRRRRPGRKDRTAWRRRVSTPLPRRRSRQKGPTSSRSVHSCKRATRIGSSP